ncbi:MAG: hypothetical protein ABIJ14_01540 [Nanoarchaeota archaeon]|nr:hypothetical protein [Nanoarchaeota archaeon]
MSKKTKKADIVIDDVPYKAIQYKNENETWWKNVPQNPEGVIGSGLHRIDKKRENSHWDIYDGDKKIGKKPIEGNLPKFRSIIINLKKGGIFPAPSENHIAVLRGSNKPMGFISLEHYQKNKKRYKVKMGDENNPDVVVDLEAINS